MDYMSKYSFEDFKSKIDPMWTAKDPNKIVEVYYFENIYHTLPQRTKKREGVVGRTPEEVYLKALHLWSPVINIENHTIKSDDTVMIDDKKKLIVDYSPAPAHFFQDILGPLLYFLVTTEEQFDEIFFLNRAEQGLSSIFNFTKQILEDYGFKVSVVSTRDLFNRKTLYINKFYLISKDKVGFPMTDAVSYQSIELINEFFKPALKIKTEPFRKIYLSRRQISGEPAYIVQLKETSVVKYAASYNKKKWHHRIDYHDEIEKMFIELGFEIICPEDFETFEDQLNYLAEAKILASISGSGLHNSMWMQPGQTVVEISSLIDGIEKYPILIEFLKTDPEPKDIWYLQKSLHPFWAGIAFYCEHLYISIPNHYGKVEKVKEYIEKRTQLKKMLSD